MPRDAAFPVVSVAGFGATYLRLVVVRQDRAHTAFSGTAMWIHLLVTIPVAAAWRDGLLRAEPGECACG